MVFFITDLLNYAVLGNPVGRCILNKTACILFGTADIFNMFKFSNGGLPNQTYFIYESVLPPILELMGRRYYIVRLAGLSGATAVLMHVLDYQNLITLNPNTNAKEYYKLANRMHLYHSLALWAVPLVRRPVLTGFLMLTGTLAFSGVLYYRAIVGEKRYARLAIVGGGALLTAAWLSIAL